MNKHLSFLQEAAKFMSGAVAADTAIGLWMVATGKYAGFFGMSFTPGFIWTWLVVDVALLLLLIHFAWHAHFPGRRPRRGFLYVAGVVFGIVAVIHLLRIIAGVPILVGSLLIPLWPNALGAVITGFLSYTSFAFARSKTK